MAQKKIAAPKSDLPESLGQPAQRALAAAGYTRLRQFTKLSESGLLKLHGFGPNAIRILRQALAAKGQSFADPKPVGASKKERV